MLKCYRNSEPPLPVLTGPQAEEDARHGGGARGRWRGEIQLMVVEDGLKLRWNLHFKATPVDKAASEGFIIL